MWDLMVELEGYNPPGVGSEAGCGAGWCTISCEMGGWALSASSIMSKMKNVERTWDIILYIIIDLIRKTVTTMSISFRNALRKIENLG